MANDLRPQLPWTPIVIILGCVTVSLVIFTRTCVEYETESERVTLNCQPREGVSKKSSPSLQESNEPDPGDMVGGHEEGLGVTQSPDLVENSDASQQPDSNDIGSSHEELFEDEAIALVKAWLEEKPRVYGSSYDREVARFHVNFPGIDAIYNDLNQLQRNDAHGPYYWKYDAPSTVDEIHSFEYFPSQGTAELVVTVSEYKSFYTRRGKSVKDSGLFTNVNKYTFGRDSNGNWKIADIE